MIIFIQCDLIYKYYILKFFFFFNYYLHIGLIFSMDLLFFLISSSLLLFVTVFFSIGLTLISGPLILLLSILIYNYLIDTFKYINITNLSIITWKFNYLGIFNFQNFFELL